MVTQKMLSQHPQGGSTMEGLVECIESCLECEQCCVACADACLGEEQLDMLRRCIRLNLDCADTCGATARMLSRQTEPEWEVLQAQLEACRMACRMCADECAQHADMHDHCRTCADCCRRCAEACDRLLSSIPAGVA